MKKISLKLPKKNKNVPIFNVFMRFLSNFRWTSLIKMLKTLNVARTRCPVGFFQELIAVFQMEKIQIAGL